MAKILLIGTVAFLGSFCAIWGMVLAQQQPERWSVYYGSQLEPEDFLPYDLIVFDSQHHPQLRPLQNRGKILLGYLSIGEAENYRDDFSTIKQMGVLLEENEHWPGHYVIDVRNPKWAKYLIEEKIPEILHKRFDGVMLDTIDSALALEAKDPVKYKSMREGAIKLIYALRMHYPDMKIMINRGYDILPDIAKQIDMLLAESILVDSHSDKDNPKFFADNIYQEYVNKGKQAQDIAPHLKIYSLDYWPQHDTANIRKIYSIQRQNGFIPYVSTVDLQAIFAEPN